MRWFRNKTFIAVIVIILAVGMVLAYVPLLFPPSPPVEQNDIPVPEVAPTSSNAAASLLGSVGQEGPQDQSSLTPSSTVASSSAPSLQGLEGLGAEQKALNDLDQQLGQ